MFVFPAHVSVQSAWFLRACMRACMRLCMRVCISVRLYVRVFIYLREENLIYVIFYPLWVLCRSVIVNNTNVVKLESVTKLHVHT